MKPSLNPGTHIATPRNGYDHHGVYAGNDHIGPDGGGSELLNYPPVQRAYLGL